MCSVSQRSTVCLVHTIPSIICLESDLALQIAWAVPSVGTDDEIFAYAELKAIISSFLSVQFRVRPTAADVQKQLGAIMQHRGWTNSLLDAAQHVSTDAASEMTL